MADSRVVLSVAPTAGMCTSGDPAAMADNKSEMLENVFVRPGPRIEMRDGWVRDGTLPGGQPVGLMRYINATTGASTLCYSATSGNGAYRGGAAVGTAVTAATNVSPIQITTSTAHGLLTGQLVTIAGVLGNTAANVTGNAITVVNTTAFTLNGVAGNGAYTSGGTVTPIWTAAAFPTSDGDVDYAQVATNAYMAGYTASTDNRVLKKFDGTTVSDPSHPIDARCARALGRRLFLANVQLTYVNLASAAIATEFETAVWTKTGISRVLSTSQISTMTGNGISPITIYTTGNHGLTTGQNVTITGVVTNTAANVTNAPITVHNSYTFSLDGTTGNGDYGGYSLGGTVTVMSSGNPSVAAVGPRRKVTIANGSTDALVSNVVHTTTTEATVSWVQWILPIDAIKTMPMRMQVRSSDGATTYGSEPIEIPASSGDDGWIYFSVQARVPASTAVKLYFLAGDGIRPAPEISFYISTAGTTPDTRVLGAFVNEGTYLSGADEGAFAGATIKEPQRIRWSEVDAPEDFRLDSWMDIKDSPGPITAMSAVNYLRLVVFKDNTIFAYSLTDSVDSPLSRDSVWYGIGTRGPKAVTVFQGKHYFIDPAREVYEFDGSSDPVPLLGDEMRETVINQSVVDYPCIEVDADNHELYVYTQAGVIYVYNLATKAWSQINLDASNTNVADLLYVKASGETRREMWAATAGSSNIVRLKSGQTQDNITGTPIDVTAFVWFKPLQSSGGRRDITVESLTLIHEVTASQAASELEVDVSMNGGSTFPYTNTVRISPLAIGGPVPCEVPLWETGPRLTLALTYSGLAGPTYFNLTSVDIVTQVHGREFVAAPTAVGDTL